MAFRQCLIAGMLLCFATEAVSAPIVVSFFGEEGTVGHEAILVNPETQAAGPAFWDDLPLILPFTGPTSSTRYTGDHPANAGGVVTGGAYTRLDGTGAVSIVPTGTSTPYGPGSLPNANITIDGAGAHLPTAAHTGALPSDLNLPGGVSLPSDTVIHSDFDNLVVDFNDAASYYYDSTTGHEHRIYRGGNWVFSYEDPMASGVFQPLAAYTDVEVALDIDFATLEVFSTWEATPVAIPGVNVLLPATGTSMGNAIDTTGFLLNETPDFAGLYGVFDGEFDLAFDIDNATSVPEPSSLALLGLCAFGFGRYRYRRRRQSISDE